MGLMAKVILAILFLGILGMTTRFLPSQQSKTSTSAFPPMGSALFSPLQGDDASTLSHDPSITFVSPSQQRDFLEAYGWTCQKPFAGKSQKNLVLERFDALESAFATQLWKYCVLYTGSSSVYWDFSDAQPLRLMTEILDGKSNLAIVMDESAVHPPLHHSIIRINDAGSKVALGMIRFIVETNRNLSSMLLSESLGLFVANEIHKNRGDWKLLKATCRESKDSHGVLSQIRNPGGESGFDTANPCMALHGEPCCQVWDPSDALPVLTLSHSHLLRKSPPNRNPSPFSFPDTSAVSDHDLGMPVKDLPFVATVRSFPTGAPPATVDETPNYFDILLENNCLPHDKECFKCLKLGYKENDEGGDCRTCEAKCPCYCRALCTIRPPPKRLSAEWEITPPRFRKDPSRLIPRVIHQTWFETVTKDKYPNMSRLIESFRQSGWEYEFYDDDKAAQFLTAHFPPQVREAYDAIIPGAFKADLFRYCVLLVRGGVYADMDILLESNLDQAIDGSIGFLTAQDSPGETIGHRSCLWNGLMAAAPGHPFLAQTIQNVVNNVRNRFTSVDYDDMLCPNPVLSVSHTVDTLFTAGPCILGASLNDVLQRHRQTGFEYGEIDLFQNEKKAQGDSKHAGVTVDREDPRLLIPGRSLLLRQNKADMGSHRFTNDAENLIIAVTDMPEYDDRPKSIEHYSKSHVKIGVYGLTKLYTDSKRANEEVTIRVKSAAMSAYT